MNVDYNIDQQSPIPLYYQIKQVILSQIKNDIFKPNDCLPTEMELMESFGVSRSTVRQAMLELSNEGYLVRRKGKGTFVAQPKVEEHLFQYLASFETEMKSNGVTPRTDVLKCQIVPAIDVVNQTLGLESKQELIYLQRVRYADEQPVVYLETYLSADKFADVSKVDFAVNSLYDTLESKYNCKVERAKRQIHAAIATKSESKHLRIDVGSLILLTRSVVYEGDTAIEYSVARFDSSRNAFTIETNRL